MAGCDGIFRRTGSGVGDIDYFDLMSVVLVSANAVSVCLDCFSIAQLHRSSLFQLFSAGKAVVNSLVLRLIHL